MSARSGRREFLTRAATLAAGGLLAGCADVAPDAAPVVSADTGRLSTSPSPSASTSSSPSTRSSPSTAPKAASGQVSFGLVPVLMHHRLVRTGAGEYDMTPEFFRALLERLARERYHPVRTIDLVRNNLASVPPGRTPVVLTFDDSTPGQVAFDARGRVRPDCALGILLDFHASHRDFPPVASFYLNKDPFGLTGRRVTQAITALQELGCEIGNHTLNHPNLRTLSNQEIEAELGALTAMTAPAAEPRTLALPFGVAPRDRKVLASGGTGRTAYRNEGVLLVGANPAVAPSHPDFDPLAIPRIRVSSHASGRAPLEVHYWLDRLRARPRLRFESAKS